MRRAPGAAVSGGIEKWVLSLGITPQEIDRFRKIMPEAPEK